MAIDYAQLARIHGLLQQREELAQRLARIPRMAKEIEGKRANAERKRDAVKQSLTAAKRLAHEKQLSLKQREDRVENLKLKRNTCETNREYQILNDQIAADLAANSVLADEILELLERIEQFEAELKEAEALVVAAVHDSQQGLNQLRQRETDLRAELDLVARELHGAERILPSEIAGQYRRMVETRGAGALAETDGETCGECHQVLTPQTRNELCQQQIVFCKGCGSLMYLSPALLARQPI